MNTLDNNITFQRKFALIAGATLILMALAAAFSYGFVQGNLVIEGDAEATFNNISTSINLFNAGIFGWLVILICDILVAWALYIFLQPIDKNLALLGAFFRLIYTAILGIAILNLVFISLLASSNDFSLLFDIEQNQAMITLFLNAFHFMWSFGLVIFSIHLLILGLLSYRSNHIPKFISILLFIAAAGYLIVELSSIFLSHYESMIAVSETILTIPMVAGEFGFALWLLFKGGKN